MCYSAFFFYPGGIHIETDPASWFFLPPSQLTCPSNFVLTPQLEGHDLIAKPSPAVYPGLLLHPDVSRQTVLRQNLRQHPPEQLTSDDSTTTALHKVVSHGTVRSTCVHVTYPPSSAWPSAGTTGTSGHSLTTITRGLRLVPELSPKKGHREKIDRKSGEDGLAAGCPLTFGPLDVPPYRKWKRPSCLPCVVFTTVVKLEESALFGSASWRAFDDTVSRVDASQIRQMKKRHSSATTASSSEQDLGRALRRKRRRASSTTSFFNLSCANRLPLCWALPLSAILFLVSPFLFEVSLCYLFSAWPT